MVGSAWIVRTTLASLAVLHIAPAWQSLAAQDTTARVVAPFDTQHVHKTLFTTGDALLAAGFVGLTVAMFPVDRHIAKELQNPNTQTNRFLDRSATGFETISSPGAFIIGGGMYAIGTLGGYKTLRDLGWHGTEAVALSSVVTSLLKGLLGRARPFVVADTNPRDFRLGGGFGTSERQSFPSGHTTTAFAAASAITSEMRRMYPQALWLVAPVMYGGATLVGLSRMYHNKHWASDVMLGAAVGTFSGLKVVRYSHTHPNNRIDRIMLHATVIPTLDGGGAVAFTFPLR